MASEIYREKQLANFRERFPEKHKSTFRQERPGMSEKHLSLIRQMPCCVCMEARPKVIVDPHHLKSGPAKAERGVYLKATDRWSLPCCRVHHEMVERLPSTKETQFFMDAGVDPHDLALALWQATGDVERMVAVLIGHREHFGQVD